VYLAQVCKITVTVAVIQVVEVMQCTRAHAPQGPTSSTRQKFEDKNCKLSNALKLSVT